MTIKRIYLDMDGVLCDFERKYTEVFGEPSMYGTDHPPSFHKNWEKFVQNDLFKVHKFRMCMGKIHTSDDTFLIWRTWLRD